MRKTLTRRGLSRLGRDARQLILVAEAVDQRGLAHVGFARDGDLRQALPAEFLVAGERCDEGCAFDLHGGSFIFRCKDVFEHVVQRIHGAEIQFLADALRHLEKIRRVFARIEHDLGSGAVGGDGLFFQPSDGQHAPAAALISPVMAMVLPRTGLPAQRRSNIAQVTIVTPAEGPSLGVAPIGHMDVQIAFLGMKIFVDTPKLRPRARGYRILPPCALTPASRRPVCRSAATGRCPSWTVASMVRISPPTAVQARPVDHTRPRDLSSILSSHGLNLGTPNSSCTFFSLTRKGSLSPRPSSRR